MTPRAAWSSSAASMHSRSCAKRGSCSASFLLNQVNSPTFRSIGRNNPRPIPLLWEVPLGAVYGTNQKPIPSSTEGAIGAPGKESSVRGLHATAHESIDGKQAVTLARNRTSGPLLFGDDLRWLAQDLEARVDKH